MLGDYPATSRIADRQHPASLGPVILTITEASNPWEDISSRPGTPKTSPKSFGLNGYKTGEDEEEEHPHNRANIRRVGVILSLEIVEIVAGGEGGSCKIISVDEHVPHFPLNSKYIEVQVQVQAANRQEAAAIVDEDDISLFTAHAFRAMKRISQAMMKAVRPMTTVKVNMASRS